MYHYIVIRTVVLSKRAQKDIMTVPDHIVAKLQGWVLDVEYRGLEEVRKVPSYHDEPLKGPLKGLRSIRLSLSYRAYYRLVENKIEFVNVEGVDKHEY